MRESRVWEQVGAWLPFGRPGTERKMDPESELEQ